jgi:hypothetical protein
MSIGGQEDQQSDRYHCEKRAEAEDKKLEYGQTEGKPQKD